MTAKRIGAIVLTALAVAILAPAEASAGWQGGTAQANKFCTATATAVRSACRSELQDDYWIAVGNCLNLADADERRACKAEVQATIPEGMAECREQFEARLEVCALVGEEPYDPEFAPADFVDPDDIGFSVAPNPYLPLIEGRTWVYEGGGETVTVVVTDKTKLIEGVTCRVVNDVVVVDGVAVEDTDDWFAQDLHGNVWYCGEEVKDYETFAGDDPVEPELVAIDGSFKAGRDGAKPGIIMLADPQVGEAYREEISLGNAEDAAEVVSLTGNESVPAATCHNDCLVIRAFTPLEPGLDAFKHYAAGVGPILEVDHEGN